MCVFIFSTTFVWNFCHYKKKWGRYEKKMYNGLPVKCLLLKSDCNETWISSIDFREILKYHGS